MNVGAMQRFTAVLVLLVPLLAADAARAAADAGTGQTQPARPQVLVFGLGERCRYCVQLKQEIAKVVALTGDAVKFVDYRVDLDREMVAKHKVVLSPTLVFLDASGSEVFRHQGLLDAAQIQEKLVELRLWARQG